MTPVLGIDPGKTGGLCFISKGEIQVGTMPKDEVELLDYFGYLQRSHGPFVIFIEMVQPWVSDAQENPGKAMVITRLFSHYKTVLTMARIAKIPLIEVAPQTWQKHLRDLGVRKKGFKNPKNAYKAFAIKTFPRLLKKINLKTADAICIAYFGNYMVTVRADEVKKKMKTY